jgi:serine protease Do
VFQRLKTDGKVSPGWLGVALRGPTDDEAEGKTGEQLQGATISNVFPESPAEKAGMLVGDVVVEWNAKAVVDFTDLGLLVARTEVDSRAKVVVIRNGKRMTLEVPVGRRPPELTP